MDKFDDEPYSSKPEVYSSYALDAVSSQATLREYEDKLRFARTKYEQRIEDLTEQVRRMYRDLQSDDVLNTMRENPVSKQFAGQRARELLEGSLMREKEATIAKLQAELIDLKGDFLRVEQENTRLQQSCRRLEANCQQEADEREDIERELLDFKARLKQQTLSLEESFKRRELDFLRQADEGAVVQRKRLEEGLKDRDAEIRRIGKELEREQLKARKLEAELDNVDFNALKRQIGKLREENEAMRNVLQTTEAENQAMKEEYMNYSREVEHALNSGQKASSETVELLQQKFKGKARQFKKKITEQKAAIEALQQQNKANRHSLDEQKRHYERTLQTLQDDLRKVRDEWQRKCHETELEAQRREAEIVSKHQLQAATLQSHYQNILEQRLSELQTELTVNRSRAQEVELKAAYEEKVREIERDYIPIAKHDSQLASIRRQLEDEAVKSATAVSELRSVKTKLQDSLELCSQLQGDIEVERATSRAVHDQQQKLHDELEASLINKRVLLQQIELGADNIEKLKSVLEDERRRRNQAEHDKTALTESLKEMQGQLTEKHATIQRNRAQLEETLKRLRDEQDESAHNESFKVQQVSFELIEAREEASRFKTERENLDTEIRELQAALSSSTREVRQVKLAEAHKYEEELTRHMETKSKLLAAEGKLKHLQSEIQDYEQRVTDLRATLRSNDQELLALRNRLNEFDSSLTMGNADRRDLQRKLERQKQSGAEFKQRLHTMVTNRLTGFKNELSSLKTLAEGELKLCKKETNSLLQDLHFMILEKLNFLRRFYDSKLKETTDELNADWSRRLNDATDELSESSTHTTKSLQEKIITQDRLLEQLRDSLAAAKREREVMQDNADQLNDRLRVVKKENVALKGELKLNSERFDVLQLEVSEHASRIKTDSDSMLDKARRDLHTRHERELGTLQRQLEGLQQVHYQELEKLALEVKRFKEDASSDWHSKFRQLEAKLEDREHKLKAERERSEEMRRQMSALEDQADSLQQQHNKALSSFEDQVSRLESSLRIEQDKQVKLRLDKTTELEQLSRQLRETSREVDTRTEKLSSVEKENLDLRSRLSEIEQNLSSQAQEFSQLSFQKERELMSLRELLTKSYTETLDPVRRAKELDRETQELTKQVRRGPQARREVTESKA